MYTSRLFRRIYLGVSCKSIQHDTISCRFSSTDPTTSSIRNASGFKFLSPKFALAHEWDDRINQLSIKELGGDDFEWISAVQKKFSGGGKASAIDLDMACTVSTQFNQIADLVELCYKLRHTDNATDLFPSTEYAMYRLLLDFNDMENFMKLLNDPINYGLFMNEHICCLFLDKFLSSGNVHYAVKVAIYVMQQELFSWPLLNFLATNALLQWAELAPSEQILDEQIHPRRSAMLEDEINFNEENVRLFRYPYLKNHYWDGHFDLSEPNQLVGKSLEWFCWYLKLAEGNEEQNKRNSALTDSICLLGLLLQQKWADVRNQMDVFIKNGKEHQELFPIVLKMTKNFFPESDTSNVENEQNAGELNAKEEIARKERIRLKMEIEQKSAELGSGGSSKLSTLLTTAFQPIIEKEERMLMEEQRKHFVAWANHRKEFIQSQVERADVMARLDEIRKRKGELMEERQLLFFFENRIRLEDEARERDELVKELGMMKKRGELTEEEYAQGMFHLARKLKEGKTAKQALTDIAESELFTRLQQKNTKSRAPAGSKR